MKVFEFLHDTAASFPQESNPRDCKNEHTRSFYDQILKMAHSDFYYILFFRSKSLSRIQTQDREISFHIREGRGGKGLWGIP